MSKTLSAFLASVLFPLHRIDRRVSVCVRLPLSYIDWVSIRVTQSRVKNWEIVGFPGLKEEIRPIIIQMEKFRKASVRSVTTKVTFRNRLLVDVLTEVATESLESCRWTWPEILSVDK